MVSGVVPELGPAPRVKLPPVKLLIVVVNDTPPAPTTSTRRPAAIQSQYVSSTTAAAPVTAAVVGVPSWGWATGTVASGAPTIAAWSASRCASVRFAVAAMKVRGRADVLARCSVPSAAISTSVRQRHSKRHASTGTTIGAVTATPPPAPRPDWPRSRR